MSVLVARDIEKVFRDNDLTTTVLRGVSIEVEAGGGRGARNLDRKSSDEVMALLRALSRDEGTAFLISTHDEQIAWRCDRIVTMEDGRIR